jgi:hypothetical protein
MTETSLIVGRVLRSSTASFTVGCSRLISEQDQLTPEFGGLVKAESARGELIYGFIYNVTIEDDAFVRQLVAADVNDEVYIEDQRQNRQVPIVVDVITAGVGRGLNVAHRLPAQPPGTLDRIYACNAAELVRFTARHDWLRAVLTNIAAPGMPADALLAAILRNATQARPPDQREAYRLAAARELARLLAMDLGRLDAIVQQLRADSE